MKSERKNKTFYDLVSMNQFINTIIFGIILIVFFIFPTRIQASILINEFLPNPIDENNEWVEVINTGTSSVNLSNYYFDDDSEFDGETGSDKFKMMGILLPNQLCYFSLSSYLNNTGGDIPTIFTDIGVIEDTYTYTSTKEEFTFSRVPDGGEWMVEQIPTKTQNTCQSLAPTPTPTPEPTEVPTPSPTVTQTATSSPTNTPTIAPTVTATIKPLPIKTSTIKPSPTPTIEPVESISSDEPSILLNNITPEAEVLGVSSTAKNPFLPLAFIFSGVGFLGYGGYSLYRRSKSEYNKHNNENL